MLDHPNTKAELRRSVLALHARLLADSPDLFSLDRPVPFRLGIHKQIIVRYPDVSSTLIRRFMGWVTCRRDYLMACAIPGVPRYDFDGPCGTVSAKEAEHARIHFIQRNSSASDPWPRERFAA